MERETQYELPPLPSIPDDDMSGPFPWCNWVIGRQVLAGAFPATRNNAETIEIHARLLQLGITVFVCLQAEFKLDEPEKNWSRGIGLRPYIKDALAVLQGLPQTDSRLECDVRGRILRGEGIYIHCWGGHGRTGSLVALLLASLYNLTAQRALDLTQSLHDTRRHSQHVRSPQTEVQRDQVRRIVSYRCSEAKHLRAARQIAEMDGLGESACIGTEIVRASDVWHSEKAQSQAVPCGMLYNDFLDPSMPIPSLLREAYKKVSKRSTPLTYGNRRKTMSQQGTSVSKAQLTCVPDSESRQGASELIKSGRMPWVPDPCVAVGISQNAPRTALTDTSERQSGLADSGGEGASTLKRQPSSSVPAKATVCGVGLTVEGSQPPGSAREAAVLSARRRPLKSVSAKLWVHQRFLAAAGPDLDTGNHPIGARSQLACSALEDKRHSASSETSRCYDVSKRSISGQQRDTPLSGNLASLAQHPLSLSLGASKRKVARGTSLQERAPNRQPKRLQSFQALTSGLVSAFRNTLSIVSGTSSEAHGSLTRPVSCPDHHNPQK